jgi:hypothetical protein
VWRDGTRGVRVCSRFRPLLLDVELDATGPAVGQCGREGRAQVRSQSKAPRCAGGGMLSGACATKVAATRQNTEERAGNGARK